MQTNEQTLAILAACDARREKRREFIKFAGGATAAVAGASLLSACGQNDTFRQQPDANATPTPTATTPAPATTSDQNVLNFALNLEYLEAQFYSYAANGVGLPDTLLGGTGLAGPARGGQQVKFSDPMVRAFAREIAADEQAHVAFLRTALGTTAVAQPEVDLSASGAFTSAARAARLVGDNATFDPYASDENFLLAAFIFEDVGVTAYKGSAALINNKTYLDAAAGILAAEAYHAGLIRTTLFRKGLATPALIDATEQISNARDSLDGSSDLDQGIRPIAGAANIVPTDGNAIAFGRSASQVLNIVYLNAAAVNKGGFFPNGVNGAISLSAATA